MPSYRFRYVCETSLQFDKDVSLESHAGKIELLFSQKDASASAVHVVVETQAPNYQDADKEAQRTLQPGLDALSFATSSPLLALHWDFIVKDETGNTTRRALWCEKRSEPTRLKLTDLSIEEARKILSAGEKSDLELCWHRYALQRPLILDRFVFQWLAFEGLAGKRQIPTICPKCKTEIIHCEKSLSHEGSDANKAHELFLQADPGGSRTDFMRDIWGRARNAVFHGTKYPAPKFLESLRLLNPKLRRACEKELSIEYGLSQDPRPSHGLDTHFYRTNLFEWQTKEPGAAFAEDFPWAAITKDFADMQPGEVRAYFPESSPYKLLKLDAESEKW